MRTNKRINTTTEKNTAEDTDEYLTTTEKVTHNQTREKENTVTVVLIVVVVVLGMLLIDCLIGIISDTRGKYVRTNVAKKVI